VRYDHYMGVRRQRVNLHCIPNSVLRNSCIASPKRKFLGRTCLLYQAVIHHFLYCLILSKVTSA